MRRILLPALFLIAAISLYAKTPYNEAMNQAHRPQGLMFVAMGESGAAIPSRDKSFFVNASFLGLYDSFSITIPTADLSLYQARDILSSPIGNIFKGDIDAILSTLSNLNGTFPLVLANQGINTIFKHFALAFDIRESIYSTGQSFASGFIPSLQTTLTIGYGKYLEVNDTFDIAFGMAEHISGVFHSSEISAESLAELLKGDGSALSFSTSSWSFSTDAALSFLLENGLSFAICLNGISNGINYMNMTTGVSFHNYSHPNITLASAWSRNLTKSINLALAYDLVDIIGMLSHPSFENFLYHSNMGASFSIHDILRLAAGLNGGYPSFALELEFFFMRLGILYRYQEFGSKVGINPKDQLTLSLSLAFH